MRIILVGFGVVGQSLLRVANSRHADLIRSTGIRPKFVGVCDSRGAAVNVRGLDVERLLQTKAAKGTVAALREFGKVGITPSELIEDTEADVVVEATSTNLKNGQPGIQHIMTSLKNRRHVITVNKGPLAHALPALLELAKHNDVYLRFSGTVGGGTPVLDFAKKCLLGERIVSLRGILNGTTNFILTKMADEEISYEMALKEAQRAGYAEKDPSLDVDGLDTAAKLVIIANWVMNLRVTLSDVNVTGIRKINQQVVEEARSRGRAIKLIGSVDKSLRVAPTAISVNEPICVNGVLNAISYVSQQSGEETIIGKGAGGNETAGAIIRDLIEIKQGLLYT